MELLSYKQESPDSLKRALFTDPENLDMANRYWRALGLHKGRDVRDGRYVVEAYRAAALASQDGVIALARAYRKLHQISGESPRATIGLGVIRTKT
jgi:hypothetical protein